MTSEEESSDPTELIVRDPDPTTSWTYPTRTCRLCLEEVPATVTLYPPGLPVAFQRPVVEYRNDDEYGRLIKPCLCRGGMRYIHELCLRRSRTETVRPGSLWKCHQCGYQFSFNRLTIQRYLGSRTVSGLLTVLVMIVVMFLLGFIADPILNLYVDPYETVIGHEDLWQEVSVSDSKNDLSSWAQHFVKGLVSMGVLSFVRTMILNPFQWWNLRNTGFVSSRASGRAATGRTRAVNISWIVVAMGILSASYLFYQSVQTIIGKSLQRIGNNIVDTQLPGDDDDIKPPPDFRFQQNDPNVADKDGANMTHAEESPPSSEFSDKQPPFHNGPQEGLTNRGPSHRLSSQGTDNIESNHTTHSMPGTFEFTGRSSALDDAQSQGWSFGGL